MKKEQENAENTQGVTEAKKQKPSKTGVLTSAKTLARNLQELWPEPNWGKMEFHEVITQIKNEIVKTL